MLPPDLSKKLEDAIMRAHGNTILFMKGNRCYYLMMEGNRKWVKTRIPAKVWKTPTDADMHHYCGILRKKLDVAQKT